MYMCNGNRQRWGNASYGAVAIAWTEQCWTDNEIEQMGYNKYNNWFQK